MSYNQLTFQTRDWSSIHRAVWREDLNTVLRQVTRSNVNAMDARGYTPLHLACSSSDSLLFSSRQFHDRGLKDRIIAGGEPCFPTRRNNPESAFQMASALIDAGANPNAKASDGCEKSLAWTPMHCVANSGWVNVAHFLFQSGGSAFLRMMCSPYCWAKDNAYESGLSPGEPTMKELCRLHISEEQMREIEALHNYEGSPL